MLDNLDPEVRELLMGLDSLTEDQLATAHLLLAQYVQLYFVEATKKQRNSVLFPYLKKVYHFLRESRAWEDSEFALYHATLLNLEFAKIFKEIFSEDSPQRTTYNGYILLRIIKSMLQDYDNVFSDKRFKELFDDISFAQNQIFSRKASNLVMHALYDYELSEGYGLEEQRQAKIKKLLDIYAQNWNSKREYYQNLSGERLLVFHGVSLLLCRKSLDEKQYHKYRTHIGKSIKRYIVSEGKIIKKVSVEYIMTGAYPKLQELLLEAIDKGYDDQDESAHRYEWFMVGNDLLLKDVENIPLEEAHQMLMEVERDKYDVFTSSKFEELAQKYLQAGQEEFERISAEIGIDKTSYQSIPGITAVSPTATENIVTENIGAKNTETSVTETSNTETDNIEADNTTTNNSETDNTETNNNEESEMSPQEPNDAISLNEAQLAEKVKNCFKLVKMLDVEHALMFHVVTVNILETRDITKERYLNYRKAVRDAVLSYRQWQLREESEVRQSVKRAFKKVEKEFNTVFDTIHKDLLSKKLKKDPERHLFHRVTVNAIMSSLEDMDNVTQETLYFFIPKLEYARRAANFKSEALNAYLLKYLIRAQKVVMIDMCTEKTEVSTNKTETQSKTEEVEGIT